MHIVHIAKTFFPYVGGMETYLHNLAVGQKKMNVKHSVITIRWNNLASFENVGPLSVYRLRGLKSLIYPHKYQAASKKIAQSLEGIDFDIIHVHDFSEAAIAGILKKVTNKPLVMTIHCFPRLTSIMKFIMQNLEVDVFIVPSEFVRKKTLRMGIPPDKVNKIYHGVDKNVFRPLKGQKEDIVLCPSRFLHLKYPTSLLKTISYVRKAITPYKFLLVENYPITDVAKKMKSEFQSIAPWITKKTVILSAVPYASMPILYNKAVLTLLTSKSETFSFSAVESFMCTTPVVAWRTTALKEIFGEELSDLLVPLFRYDLMKEKLTELLDSQFLLHRIGRKSRSFMSRKFSIETMSKKTAIIYSSLLQ